MKKNFLFLLFVCVIFCCSGCTKVAVVLNSDVENSEKYLDEAIQLNNLDYITKNSETHVYTIGEEGLYSAMVNLVRTKDITSGETTKRLDGHYSCYMKELEEKHTLIKCSDSSSFSRSLQGLLGLYFTRTGYRGYFNHLEYNGYEIVSYKEYQKLKKENKI